ncbi:helix-turn-helix domain-containing protein [Bacillus mangrovi]|uniref:Helix-turn-helix domain-containing protein n=1 Tax=Metabacillus mangrovi TaxID=1491830 RepID=A0A7X2V2W1_9BACI|nr:AraC family transcriptional regulator [Metabacillus mangrovi]MTH51900.1 helix-turn-helix domain-containing protein [Metabacillus mangrovi]
MTQRLNIHQHTYWESLNQFLLKEDTYPHWSIFCIESGLLRYTVLNKSGTARPGSFLLCPPGIPLQREAVSPLNFHFFQFELQGGGELHAGEFTIKDTNRIESNFSYLRRYAHEQDEKAISLKEHFLLDFFCLREMEGEKELLELGPLQHQDPIIYQAILYLRNHAFQQISLNSLAKEMGLSSVQFTRRFAKNLGMTPIDYLTAIRIREARQQLLETDKTLDTIAKECGFNNGFYLSRVFKKRMKMSPASYRRTHWI